MAKNKAVQQMQKARRSGMTPLEMLMIREAAKKESAKLQEEAMMDAFLCMIAIPLNVLLADYWQKSGKKRAGVFVEECFKLFNAFIDGVVTKEEMNDFVWDAAGIRVDEIGAVAKDKGTRRWKKYPEV